MMERPAYAVAHIRDIDVGPDVLRYMELIEETFQPFGGTWLVHGAESECVEGRWEGDLVIVAFPSLEKARAWYRSTTYQAILNLRAEHSDSSVVLVPGVPSGYRAAETIAKLRS